MKCWVQSSRDSASHSAQKTILGTHILDVHDTGKSSESVDTGSHIYGQVSKPSCNILTAKTSPVCHNDSTFALGVKNRYINVTENTSISTGIQYKESNEVTCLKPPAQTGKIITKFHIYYQSLLLYSSLHSYYILFIFILILLLFMSLQDNTVLRIVCQI